MLYFDIDGVLRDLCTPILGRQASHWNEKTDKGLNIIEAIEADLTVLATAPIFEYVEVAMNSKEFTILSCQPLHWRYFTNKWLDDNLPGLDYGIIYTLHMRDKLKYLKEGDVLVEDYPKFDDHEKIILVDRPYNQEADARVRVSNVEELLKELEKY